MTTPRELRAARAPQPRRTYSCLEGQQHKPTDYEITSTALLYYPERGFEVATPVWQHYLQHQRGGLLRGQGWDSFQDPAQLTYSAYVAERRDQEAYLDRLLERPHAGVKPELRPLLGVLSALRFPLHGMQMVAAYVGSMAPSGRISIAAAFQAADELRRVQRLCQWLSRSGSSAPEIDALGRELWQQGAAFQPLRRLLEQLLVEYDWGAALVALNGVIKPIFDRLWFEQLSAIAERQHDEILEKILSSLGDDGRWHEAWFVSFARVAAECAPENAQLMRRSAEALRPLAAEAAQALLPAFGSLFGDDGGRAFVWRELDQALAQHLRQAGLQAESSESAGKNGETHAERR